MKTYTQEEVDALLKKEHLDQDSLLVKISKIVNQACFETRASMAINHTQ